VWAVPSVHPTRRYGGRVKRPVCACVVVCVAIYGVASCSSTAAKKSTPERSPCALIAQLDAIATSVAHAPVADPDAYARARDAATTKYTAAVRALKKVAPDDLQADLDRIEAGVHQGRIDDAVNASPALRSYAESKCGAVASTTTTVQGSASTTIP
jgi:hypothetical protein